jgi:hypothetical protein
MANLIKAVKDLIGEIVGAGPTGVAVLALLVALSAIWVLGVRL